MTLAVIFSNGKQDSLLVSVGPFRDDVSLESWYYKFESAFQMLSGMEPSIAESAIEQIKIRAYEPEMILHFPEDPGMMAEEFIGIFTYLKFGSDQSDWDEPFFWIMNLELTLKRYKNSDYIPIVCGAFQGHGEAKRWRSNFIREVRKRASQISGVKARVVDEEYIPEEGFEVDEDKEVFFLTQGDNVKQELERIFSYALRGMIREMNF